MAGDGDAPAGQVDVLEGEFADGPGAGGVHGGQGDGQALGGSGGRLLDSPDLLGGHRQHGAPGGPAAAEVAGWGRRTSGRVVWRTGTASAAR